MQIHVHKLSGALNISIQSCCKYQALWTNKAVPTIDTPNELPAFTALVCFN